MCEGYCSKYHSIVQSFFGRVVKIAFLKWINFISNYSLSKNKNTMKAYLILPAIVFMFETNCSAQKNSFSLQANKFLTSLSAEQSKKALYSFENDERYNWNYIPLNNRKGIMLSELNEKQKQYAFDLLKMYLSDTAFRQAKEIIQLEVVLKELENRAKSDKYRDPGNYTFLFFGKPSDTSVWGWRFEGHHISFSFSTANNKIVAGTPGFMGANPAIVLTGPQKGEEVLKSETELGFELIRSFTPEQFQKAAISNEVPSEIVTSNSRKAMIENPKGIFYAEMKTEQQKIFLQLLSVYINRYTEHFADDMMHEIEDAGLNNLRFAWSGSKEHAIGNPYYYRIQGPTLIIELDNTQNNANHVHTVIRDLKHDFGGDELLQHYKQYHQTKL